MTCKSKKTRFFLKLEKYKAHFTLNTQGLSLSKNVVGFLKILPS